MSFILYNDDCLTRLKQLEENSIDSIVTDPPYGLSFMGKKWDYDVPSQEIWAECLRVLKPGGHLLAFAGTRTQHRMAVRIEDAGFEIRDMIAWVYGSGFPKSMDVSKYIDKAAGAEREEIGESKWANRTPNGCVGVRGNTFDKTKAITATATEAARQWQGWGTALKPALEPITVARKPLIGTVAENVLAHGTGALNIDATRVGTETRINAGMSSLGVMHDDEWKPRDVSSTVTGRWPANLIHDGSDEVVGLFPADKQGSAARYFYCAKASKRDRDDGLDGFQEKTKKVPVIQTVGVGLHGQSEDGKQISLAKNFHPTVKPTDLMRYLCRLVTPPNGVVLDPFMGSGSTGKAAMLEGFQFIGIERESEYVEIAKARIQHALDNQEKSEPDTQLGLDLYEQ